MAQSAGRVIPAGLAASRTRRPHGACRPQRQHLVSRAPAPARASPCSVVQHWNRVGQIRPSPSARWPRGRFGPEQRRLRLPGPPRPVGQAAERDGDVLHHLALQANALPGEESSLRLTPGGGVGLERVRRSRSRSGRPRGPRTRRLRNCSGGCCRKAVAWCPLSPSSVASPLAHQPLLIAQEEVKATGATAERSVGRDGGKPVGLGAAISHSSTPRALGSSGSRSILPRSRKAVICPSA